MRMALNEMQKTIKDFKLKTVENLLEVEILAKFVKDDASAIDVSHVTVGEVARWYTMDQPNLKSKPLADSIFKVLQENNIKPVQRRNGRDRYSFYDLTRLTDVEYEVDNTMSLTEYLDRTREYIGRAQFEMHKDEKHTHGDWTWIVTPLN